MPQETPPVPDFGPISKQIAGIFSGDIHHATEFPLPAVDTNTRLSLDHPLLKEILEDRHKHPVVIGLIQALSPSEKSLNRFNSLRSLHLLGILADHLRGHHKLGLSNLDLTDNARLFLIYLTLGIHEHTESELNSKTSGRRLRQTEVLNRVIKTLALTKDHHYRRQELINLVLNNDQFWTTDWTSLAHPAKSRT